MEKYFKFRNGRIHYTDQGSGETVMLIHGYLETSEIWECFAGRLAENFRVLTVDIPGHGKSDICSPVLTMEFIAGVLKELLAGEGIMKAFLVGHSLGGYVTLAFAEIYCEMLSGYCLFHSHPLADTPETIEKRKQEINLVEAGRKDLVYPGAILKMFAAPGNERFREELKRSVQIASKIPGDSIIAVLTGMMERPSRLSVMERGIVPCLWILGAMDNYIDCNAIRTKVKLPASAEIVILKNSGHLGFIEEEDLSLEVLSEFIKGRVISQGNQWHTSE